MNFDLASMPVLSQIPVLEEQRDADMLMLIYRCCKQAQYWYDQLATFTLMETNFLHKEHYSNLNLGRCFTCSNLVLI